jgi:phage shock protein A
MAGLFKRMSDIINANINDLLDHIEDPERMIKQIIREMEENINQCKEGVITAIASEKRLFRELETHRHHAQEWLQKAQTALELDKEELARSALKQKKEIDKIISGLEPAWESAQATSERLKTQLRQLEAKLTEAKLKRSTLIARQQAAKARYQLHTTVDKLQANWETQTCFNRMEDKIADMESRTEALAELDEDRSPLEKEFLDMEINQEVEAELASLKIKIPKQS